MAYRNERSEEWVNHGRRSARSAAFARPHQSSSPTAASRMGGADQPERYPDRASAAFGGDPVVTLGLEFGDGAGVGHGQGHTANGAETHCAGFCAGGNRCYRRQSRQLRAVISGPKVQEMPEDIDWRRRGDS